MTDRRVPDWGKHPTAALVRFVTGLDFSAIPGTTRQRFRECVLDVVGSTVAAAGAAGVSEMIRALAAPAPNGECALVGRPERLSLLDAVAVTTTMARALELDDVHEKALLHPTVATVPASLVLCQSLPAVSGPAFITANVAAMEVTCRLGLAPEYHVAGDKHRPRGFSLTYQCGTLGASLVTSRLLRLSPELAIDAVGNAYTAMAGNQQCIQEGALAVRVQQGLSARDGVLSAFLAQAGITGPHDVLEGKFGYYNVYHLGGYDVEPLLSDLGSRFELEEISTKVYPCCKITHPSIEAVIELAEEHGFTSDDVDSVVIHVNSRETWDEVCQPLDAKRRPANPVDAQFSLPYCVAVALANGTVRLDDFLPAAIRLPKTLALADRILPVIDADADISAGRVMPMPVEVEVQLRNGSVHKKQYRYPKGHPRNPLEWDEVVTKFRTNVAYGLPDATEADVSEVVSLVGAIDDLADVRTLWDAILRLGQLG